MAWSLHDAAGELVDDLDLAVGDHVLLVAMEHVLRLQRLLEMVDQLAGEVGVDVLDAQALLDLLQALLGRGDGMLRLVHHVVAGGLLRLGGGQHVALDLLAALEAADGARELLVRVGGLGAGAGDDEGRTGLIDQDGVDLVDDRVGVAALHAAIGARDHVVAQVVETELGVGSVGDVGLVGRALLLEGHAVLQQAHGHAQEAVDAAHPLGVALGEVVVDGDHVHALAGDGVEVAGERGDEGLALAGLHLGDMALVQGHGADELDIEVAHAGHALRGLSHDGERLGKHRVERLAVSIALAEELGLALELLVAHRDIGGLEPVDLGNELLIALEVLIGSKREQLRNESHVASSSFIPVLEGGHARARSDSRVQRHDAAPPHRVHRTHSDDHNFSVLTGLADRVISFTRLNHANQSILLHRSHSPIQCDAHRYSACKIAEGSSRPHAPPGSPNNRDPTRRDGASGPPAACGQAPRGTRCPPP